MKAFANPNNYLPIINGLIGDKLAIKMDSWAIPMSFRVNGKDVPVFELDRSLKGKKLVVYIHGLMADERVWKRFVDYDRSFAVLHVRYNTGLHISQNGLALSRLLHELDTRFAPKSLFLAGHSMGGLVLRSACHYAGKEHHLWVNKVAVIFLLAVPNAGAALEKLGHVTSFTLRKIALWHLGKIGNLLEQRSNGIKDLRHGSMLEEDWNPSLSKAGNQSTRNPVPPVPGISYHILIGTLSKNESSLMAKYFGDGLVTQHSAVGVTLMKVATIQTFAKTGHNAILSNPEVHRYIHKVLKRGR